MRFFIALLLGFNFINGFSQEIDSLTKIIVTDSLYREDQFYAGFNLNVMYNKPQGYSITKISPSFFAGFMRDFPINKARTFALATGFGSTYNKYSHNLVISNQETTTLYQIADVDFDKNKLETTTLDLPIEVRWRTSTSNSHRFLRVYTGLKMSYIIFSKSVYQDSAQEFKLIRNKDLTAINATSYVSFGYNTWNLYAGYDLTPIFKKSSSFKSETLQLNPFKIGLIFYIL